MPTSTNKKIDGIKKSTTPATRKQWYHLTLSEVSEKLKTTKKGITPQEAKKRLEEYGPNVLPSEPRAGAVVLFFRQFRNSLTYILFIAAGVSFFLDHAIDGYIILAAVGFNVIVGFIQEYKAENALASLKKIITQTVWVVREGKEREIESSQVVPGDVLVLIPGLKIPADGRLFESEHLKINEAALTGESEAVHKSIHTLEGDLTIADQQNMIFSGTVVTEGRGKCFVVATEVSTEIGKIAQLVKQTKIPRTPLQTKLDRFSRKLGILVLGLSVGLVLFGVYDGYSFREMFITSVAVAVAAIPESLIIVVTIVLVTGMQKILKKGSLVRKLVAAETLGSTSVMCVDKTGTLTLGEMRVVRLVSAHHDSESSAGKDAKKDKMEIERGQWELRILHKIAINCNNAVIGAHPDKEDGKGSELIPEVVIGSSTEKALLLSGLESGFDEKDAESDRPRLDEIPFDSQKKFMMTLHNWTAKQNVVYMKGAPEKVINSATKIQSGRSTRKIDAAKRKELLAQYEKISRTGLRVLAAAYKSVPVSHTTFDEIPDYNEDLIFVGFWGLKDPLRPDVVSVLEETKKSGIRTIMITGDNQYTALTIARELGMKPKDDDIIDGSDLASISDRELEKVVRKVKVFSRATPEDKLRIVNALQANGEVVAMTGDGVNDAPALQKADIGVAVGSGTDVAKETADLVLLDNQFSTMVAAVRQGRVIYDNIRKVILYLLANSFTEMALVVVSMLLGWPLPILAAQILWINLVTDGLPDLALTQEPEEPEIMNEQPQKRDVPILDFERRFLIVFISIITSGVTLGLFYLVWKSTNDLDRARTVAFTAVGVESLLYVFSVRSVRSSIFETKLLANRWLIAAVGGGFFIQVLGIYLPFFQLVLRTVPLSVADWLLILVTCFWIILIIELAKHVFIVHRREVRGSA